MNKKFLLFSIIIVVIAAIPRSIELISGNYLFGFDQGLFFQAVKQIVVDKELTLIGAEVGGRGGFFQGPGWYYLLSIPFALTKGNPYGAMVLMLILGLLTVILSMVFVKKMYGSYEAIAIGFLIAISPLIIEQSRFIWPPFPVSLLTVFFLFFVFRVLQKKQYFFPLVTFTIGMIAHLEVAIAGTLFLQLLILSPAFFIKRLVSFRFFLFSLISFLFPLSPLIVFDLRNNFLITKGLLRFATGSDTPHDITRVYIEHMFVNHLDVFKYNFLSAFHFGEVLWIPLMAIMLYGVFAIIKDREILWSKKAFIVYLTISPLILFSIFMLYFWPMWPWWILELYIFYSFIFGIISVYLWKKLIWRLVILGIFIAFFISFVNQSIGFYKNDFKDYGGTHKIKGKIDALDYIYNDAKGEKFGLLVFTPPIYTYVYDYLIWWHGERKYDYLPHKDKKGTFYLLIEPDPHKPWTYKGWLETVVKTGKVIKTKELPSGFIIQKRIGS